MIRLTWSWLRRITETPAPILIYPASVPLLGFAITKATANAPASQAFTVTSPERLFLATSVLVGSAIIWAIFVLLHRSMIPGYIFDNRSREEFLEKSQKSFGNDIEWPSKYTAFVTQWDNDDTVGSFAKVIFIGLLVCWIFAIALVVWLFLSSVAISDLTHILK